MDTYRLFVLAHRGPPLRDHLDELRRGQVGVLGLELLAHLVLEEDVRGGRALWGVRVFNFFGRFALLLLAVALLVLVLGCGRFALPAVDGRIVGKEGKVVRDVGAFAERRCDLGKFLEQLGEGLGVRKNRMVRGRRTRPRW